jgi:hypothetical protein
MNLLFVCKRFRYSSLLALKRIIIEITNLGMHTGKGQGSRIHSRAESAVARFGRHFGSWFKGVLKNMADCHEGRTLKAFEKPKQRRKPLLQSVKKSILRRHKWLEKTEKPRETRMH